jgi:hypothetical protein
VPLGLSAPPGPSSSESFFVRPLPRGPNGPERGPETPARETPPTRIGAKSPRRVQPSNGDGELEPGNERVRPPKAAHAPGSGEKIGRPKREPRRLCGEDLGRDRTRPRRSRLGPKPKRAGQEEIKQRPARLRRSRPTCQRARVSASRRISDPDGERFNLDLFRRCDPSSNFPPASRREGSVERSAIPLSALSANLHSQRQ